MTAIATFRAVAARARRRCAGIIALVVAVGSLVMGGSAVRADQTVYFDGAGNAPYISLIGDSTLTGVRWYADYGALEQFNFVLSAESCRRTIEQSCISREGYRSANVLRAMRTLDGELGEVLVVMSGYNDPVWTIDEAIAAVVDEARRQGVAHVVWLSLRTSDDVDYSDPQEQSSINTFREYNEQLFAVAAASDGYLQVADWATYSNGAPAWFEADGVHLTPRGVDAVTTFIAGTTVRVLAGENVSPAAAPWTVLVPGAEGEMITEVQEALIAAGHDCCRHDRARTGSGRRCRRAPRIDRQRGRRSDTLDTRRHVGGRRSGRRDGRPPAVRPRPARCAALGARPPGDVAAPQCRRHATSRRTPDCDESGGPHLRPPTGATHSHRSRRRGLECNRPNVPLMFGDDSCEPPTKIGVRALASRRV